MDSNVKKILRILLLEDVPTDAELVERELKRNYYQYEILRVDNEFEFLKALDNFEPDLILSDYSLPTFDGISALSVSKEKYPTIPFIFVTGAIGEERAIETLKQGATDYVLKDRLSRLGPAVFRALKEIHEFNEKQNAEKALIASEHRLKTILDTVQAGIFIIDSKTRKLVDVNPAALNMIGSTREEVLGSVCHKFICMADEDQCPVLDLQQKIDHSERLLRKSNGETIPIIKSVVDVEMNGHSVLIENFVSISDQKKAEEKIKASLKEKEVLLQEIHHRVKNNLQVICSLLSLQAKYVKDKNAFEMFMESRARVRSMAIIHEKLYQSEDFSHIKFSDYVESLVVNLFRIYQVDPGRIHIFVNVKDVMLGLELSVPCGLVINELISNAINHAFPVDWKGSPEIKVSLCCNANNDVELIVEDNGKGMDDIQDQKKNTSLGLELVSILIEDQLCGELNVNTDNGTKYHITFPAGKKPKSK